VSKEQESRFEIYHLSDAHLRRGADESRDEATAWPQITYYSVKPRSRSWQTTERNRLVHGLESQNRLLRKWRNYTAFSPMLYTRAARLSQSSASESLASRLVLAPGARFLDILPWFFKRKTIEETFTPALLDMRYEYFEALAAKRVWLARAIYLRWAVSMFQVIVIASCLSTAKKIAAIWKIVG